MAIAAHPGDALFTMGATLANHIHNGGEGVFVNLSLGERGHPTIPTDTYGQMQRIATEDAARLLGAETEFLTYQDAEIPADQDAALAVCDLIRKHKPSIAITHWKGSWHKDHRNTYLVVQDAIFYADLRSLPRALPAHPPPDLYYADNWEDADNYRPDTFLDTSAVHEKWLEACALFPMWRGETGLIRYNDYYRSLAVMRGCLASFNYAVALMSEPEQRVKKVQTLDSRKRFL
ncbi:MAG: LmbE family protein [Bryobacterales bacterium]|nr:LmbE family protein [Bryobacterales bacterium]